MSKPMVSRPGVWLAAIKASRSDTRPSLPGCAHSASIDEVSPSTTSAVVVTSRRCSTSVISTVIAAVSARLPSLTRTTTR